MARTFSRASATALAMLAVTGIAVTSTRAGAQATPPYVREWQLPVTVNAVSSPNGLAISGDDKLYVADITNHLVLVYTLGGTLLNQWPVPDGSYGIAVAQTGEVCVASGSLVQVYTNTGTLVRSIGVGNLSGARDVAITPQGDLVVIDPAAHALQKFSLDGSYLGSLGVGLVGEPVDVAIGSDGTLYVTDENAGLNCVWKLSPGGTMLAKWGSAGADPGQFNGPAGICLISGAQGLYVCDHNNGRIQRLSPGGAFVAAWSYAAPGQTLGVPLDIVMDRFGQLYQSDPAGGRILVYGEAPVPTSRTTWSALKARFR